MKDININKCRIPRRVIAGILFTVFAVITTIYVLHYAFNKHGSGSYCISRESDGVTIDFGRIFSTHKPLEFTLPLYQLGISAKSIKKVKSNCSCTIAKIKPQDKNIHITYIPNPEKVHVRQQMFIIPHDETIGVKVIRIKGDLIPAWFAQPASIVLNKVYPGERRIFSVNVEINYELPEILIKSICLKPKTDICFLRTRITDRNRFIIDGVVNGLSQSYAYNGNIEIGFGTGPFEEFTLPIEINHTGTISAIPEIVTLNRNKHNEAIVQFRHFENLPLNIDKIDSPEYLEVIPVKSNQNGCLLRVGLRENVTVRERATLSKIEVSFTGIEPLGFVRVVVISEPQVGSKSLL